MDQILARMRNRRSVRTFDGNPLRAEDLDRILAFAKMVETPYDLPITWKLLDAKKDGLSCPVIVGTDTYIAGKMLRAPHAEEAFGYAFEKIVLFAESLGVGTTWIAGTMDRQAFERAVRLEEGEVMPCVSPLGYAAKKMSLRETMMRKGVRADSRLEFSALFFRGSFDSPLSPASAGDLAPALEAVQLAPSAVNKQPWRVVLCENKAHFYLKHNRGRTPDGGWDVQKVDMGIALCRFALAAAKCGTHVSFETADPGLAAALQSFREQQAENIKRTEI